MSLETRELLIVANSGMLATFCLTVGFIVLVLKFQSLCNKLRKAVDFGNVVAKMAGGHVSILVANVAPIFVIFSASLTLASGEKF